MSTCIHQALSLALVPSEVPLRMAHFGDKSLRALMVRERMHLHYLRYEAQRQVNHEAERQRAEAARARRVAARDAWRRFVARARRVAARDAWRRFVTMLLT